MSTPAPLRRVRLFLFTALVCLGWAGYAQAEEKGIYSPIIHVDKAKGVIWVSSDAKIIGVELPDAAKPYLDQLPVSGMIDIVVEIRPGNAPLLKTWKVMSGESSCKHFDGTACK